MTQFLNNPNEVSSGMNAVTGSIPEGPSGVTGFGGVNPEVTSALDFGDEETRARIQEIIDTVDNVTGMSRETEDLDEQNASEIAALGGPVTELSSGGPSGSPAGSAMSPMQAMSSLPSAASMPMQAMPTMAQMPMQAMSQMPMQAMSSSSGGSPYSSAPYGTGSASGRSNDPLIRKLLARGVDAGRISTGQVRIKKTGLGSLDPQQFRSVIDKALDLNGIPDNPKTRAQWHQVLSFMAEKESSFAVDAAARSESDYNVQISQGQQGPDREPVHTSRGIFQTVPGTFAQFHVPGTSTNIYDPLASAAAAVNYIVNDPKYSIDPRGGSELRAFYNARRRNGYTGY